MNWTGIIAGAIGGAVGVLVSALVTRLFHIKSQSLHTVIVIAAVALSVALSREYVQPSVAASQAEDGLLKLPVYQALQQYEPVVYARVVQVIKDGVAKNVPNEVMWSETRPLISGVIERRSKTASDDALRLLGAVVVEEVGALYNVGDNSCHAMLAPAAGQAPVDMMKVVGKDVAERELAAQTAIIQSSGSAPQPVPTANDVQPQMERVGEVLRKSYSEADLASLQNPTAPGVDKRKICAMTLTLYKEALSWPPAESGKLMRFMMSGTE